METISRPLSLCWLSSAGLSPDQIRIWLENEPDPVQIYESFQRTRSIPAEMNCPEKIAQTLFANSQSAAMGRWERLLEQHGIQALCCLDPDYPAQLKDLPEAPAILFYQGNIQALRQASAAMVGSRSATYKGLEATRQIAERLSNAGIAIISGLAHGIDAAAHQGCLKGKSPTIAVLGCGLDQDYPAENASLRRQIMAQGGLTLSEYTPGEKPLGWHFPYRNRIISGLADCLILMEARIRSGSMTTVQHALNQGKDVFVYPGEPGNPKSEANHQLLREGAIYFTTAEDIMEDMGWLDKRQDVGQNIESPAPAPLPPVSATEQQVLNQLEKGEQSFDQLCKALGMPAAMLNATLSMLQIQGLVEALPGKIYQRKA
ncbi:MAG: DNA-processing protein DprA [Clostridia bacterium]|nr:DNA-processing protein DprA [Clostridia bacterium]